MALPPAFHDAEQHHRAGRLGEAATLYRKAMVEQPDAAEIWHRLALVGYQRGDFEGSLQLATGASQRDPTTAKFVLQKGAAYLALRRHADAVTCFESALAIAPDNIDAIYNLGLALLELQRARDARDCFDRVLAARPSDFEALSNKGLAQCLDGDYAEADTTLRAVAKQRPGRAADLINLGSNALAWGREEQALDHYRRACTLDPRSALALSKVGEALHRMERFGEALEAAERALGLEPGHAAAVDIFDGAMVALQAQSRAPLNASEASTSCSVPLPSDPRLLSKIDDEVAQRRTLAAEGNPDARKLVWFLTLSKDGVNGGVMSICSIHDETRRLAHVHQADVVATTFPKADPLRAYTKFPNSMPIAQFRHAREFYRDVEEIILHVPEGLCRDLVRDLSSRDRAYLSTRRSVHVNVLLQNIDYLQPSHLDGLRALATRLTCTTAHERYSTRAMAEHFGMTLHRLSVFFNESLYRKRTLEAKEDILVVSPDENEARRMVLGALQVARPDIKIVTVQNMRYEDYKDLVLRAKWSLTFGEGLDAYFAEMAWSGGVPFAVFNDRFFSEDYRALPTIYPSWEELARDLPAALDRLNRQPDYEQTNGRVRETLARFYQFDEYQRNLQLFYEGKYTHPI